MPTWLHLERFAGALDSLVNNLDFYLEGKEYQQGILSRQQYEQIDLLSYPLSPRQARPVRLHRLDTAQFQGTIHKDNNVSDSLWSGVTWNMCLVGPPRVRTSLLSTSPGAQEKQGEAIISWEAACWNPRGENSTWNSASVSPPLTLRMPCTLGPVGYV